MSEPLVVSIPHHLGKEQALRRLKTGLAEVGTSFGHLFSASYLQLRVRLKSPRTALVEAIVYPNERPAKPEQLKV